MINDVRALLFLTHRIILRVHTRSVPSSTSQIMTSKKLRPLSSLFQQWSSQPDPQPSYKILLQSTYSLQSRIQAAETVENPQLYRRAGLRTPTEAAVRDIMGGYAWIQHLLELGRKADCKIVWIRTQTRKASSRLYDTAPFQMTVIDASNNPWGWDEDEGLEEGPSLGDLNRLAKVIKTILNQSTKVMLVWESLTPLFMVHGFNTTLRFLNSFRNCLQVWPVRIDTLTEQEHARLEDAAQALLYLQGGEMTMIRQGIREAGNIVREMLHFHLVKKKNNHDNVLYELEEEDRGVPSSQIDDNVLEEKSKRTGEQATTKGATSIPSTQRPKVELRLEDEGDDNSNNGKGRANQTETSSNRPRIFLQDDDPEFDDLDEEDPDDDLDI